MYHTKNVLVKERPKKKTSPNDIYISLYHQKRPIYMSIRYTSSNRPLYIRCVWIMENLTDINYFTPCCSSFSYHMITSFMYTDLCDDATMKIFCEERKKCAPMTLQVYLRSCIFYVELKKKRYSFSHWKYSIGIQKDLFINLVTYLMRCKRGHEVLQNCLLIPQSFQKVPSSVRF